MSAAGFWDKPAEARDVLKKLRIEKGFLDRYATLRGHWDDLGVLLELSQEDGDEAARDAAEAEKNLRRELDAFELSTLLNEEHDLNHAILSIHPGAGGTESQDWAEMLFRMYLRWVEANGFRANILDYQPGDEAGLKDATIEVEGEYAYGYLKAESGIHRLVRISPFDAAKRRHTSFASVDVIAEIEEGGEITIPQSELKVDTYRSGGKGGQNDNKVETAVRITHLPTGLIAASQSQRSQHQNRATAMKMLLSKLYALREDQQRAEMERFYGEKGSIGWGYQIRSYVLQPYRMVKDLRTGHQTSGTDAVLDGELDAFVQAWLRAGCPTKRMQGVKDEEEA